MNHFSPLTYFIWMLKRIQTALTTQTPEITATGQQIRRYKQQRTVYIPYRTAPQYVS
jgi:hypothetical protein